MGTISGIADGVLINGSAGTVFNAGTIEAPGAFAVRLAAGHANRVAMAPGAVFNGTVDGGNVIGGATISTLELAAAAAQGTLSGLNTQFVDFTAITVDAHANWTISSAIQYAIQNGQRLTNNGTRTPARSWAPMSPLTSRASPRCSTRAALTRMRPEVPASIWAAAAS